MNQEDINSLFQQYLSICNQALYQHKEEFPYKHIWEAVETLQEGKDIDLIIYDNKPKNHYKVRLHNKQLNIVDSDTSGRHDGWKLNISYLREVINHPQDYIDHPAKLDWDWLGDRVGL